MENKDNRNMEEEMDTASEAKAGEDAACEDSREAEMNPDKETEAADSGGDSGEGCKACGFEEDNSENSAECDASQDDDSAGEKEGFFKKKKKDKKDEQIEELNDRLKRQMAEFENFRKRSEKEKSQMFDMGAKTIVEKILPVIDNFERGLAAVPDDKKDDPFITGMDKVYKQMLTELDAAGVKPIECVGQEFDPDFHNAVMQVENDELESGTVAQELQKGYMYKDSVVRHSMVSVVQ